MRGVYGDWPKWLGRGMYGRFVRVTSVAPFFGGQLHMMGEEGIACGQMKGQTGKRFR